MGLTRHDLEQLQADVQEEGGQADFSSEQILAANTNGAAIDYRGLDIHHCLANYTHWPAIDLSRMQAPYANLADAFFEQSILTSANFNHAHLIDARFKEVTMPEATFREADLSFTQITNSWMTKADFGACVAPGLVMKHTSPAPHCNLNQANFCYAHLSSSHFDRCLLHEAAFGGANLTNATFQRCDLREANFFFANLTNVSFSGSYLPGVHLTGADLTGVCFERVAQLREVNLWPIEYNVKDFCAMRPKETIYAYVKTLQAGETMSLPEFLGIPILAQGAAYTVEQFTHGLLPKKNETGEIDPRYSDEPVRTILIEWIEDWLQNN